MEFDTLAADASLCDYRKFLQCEYGSQIQLYLLIYSALGPCHKGECVSIDNCLQPYALKTLFKAQHLRMGGYLEGT